LDVRSDVDNFLYCDVLPLLSFIKKVACLKCGILTNSNAAISSDSTLGAMLDISLHAGDVGASKPSAIPFLAVAQRIGCCPSRVLYVGDSYQNDIVGAHLAGMKTAYLRRPEVSDSTYAGFFQRYAIKPTIELQSLQIDEIQQKLQILDEEAIL
jgi:FMN phosphatase YigB (HAD superfamily)